MACHGGFDESWRDIGWSTRLAGLSAWFGDGECLGLETGRAYLIVDGRVGGQKARVGRVLTNAAGGTTAGSTTGASTLATTGCPSVGTGIIAMNDGVDDRLGWKGRAVVVVLGDVQDVRSGDSHGDVSHG